DAVCILAGNRRRWNRRHVGLILNAAGMRCSQTDRPHRSYERGNGTGPRGSPSTAGAVAHRVGVVRERLVEENDLSLRLGGVTSKVVEAVDDEYIGFETSGWRRHAPTEANERNLMSGGIDDLGALAATHPLRHHHLFGPHVVETVLLHGVDRPGDRTR